MNNLLPGIKDLIVRLSKPQTFTCNVGIPYKGKDRFIAPIPLKLDAYITEMPGDTMQRTAEGDTYNSRLRIYSLKQLAIEIPVGESGELKPAALRIDGNGEPELDENGKPKLVAVEISVDENGESKLVAVEGPIDDDIELTLAAFGSSGVNFTLLYNLGLSARTYRIVAQQYLADLYYAMTAELSS